MRLKLINSGWDKRDKGLVGLVQSDVKELQNLLENAKLGIFSASKRILTWIAQNLSQIQVLWCDRTYELSLCNNCNQIQN